MDLTKQLITPEGEKWEHKESYTDENGIPQSRMAPLTLFKVARESLLGQVGGRILNSIPFTMWRWAIYNKLAECPSNPQISGIDKLLLKKLVVRRFDIAPSAQLIKEINKK